MRALTLGTLRLHARRYVAAVVAVTLGVAFVVATHVLTSSARVGLLADLADSYAGADVVVTGMTSDREVAGVVTQAERLGLTASVNGFTQGPVAAAGVPLGTDTSVGTVATEPALRWQRLVAGAHPTGPGEALVDQGIAATHEVAVGDVLTFGSGPTALDVTVAGIAGSTTGSHQDDAYVVAADLARFADFVITTDVVVDADGADAAATAEALRQGLGDRVSVQTLEQYLVRAQAAETRDVDVVGAVMLVFAGIALFVAALVIANTFTLLLAHRQRDLALLRCVGASRRQVVRLVRTEALAVGAGASALGLLVGAGLGYGLVGAAGRLVPTLPLGHGALSPLWLAGAWLGGVALTLAATLVPARRGTRVAPLAALRPAAAPSAGSRAGRLRILLALLALWAGVALLALAVRGYDIVVMLAGGFVSFVGVLLLGPLLVPAAIRAVTAVVGRLGGATTRLAGANAVRHPRRTAATAASLLLGVTLVSGMVVGQATVRATAAQEMDDARPLDVSLTADRAVLNPAFVDRVQATEGVGEVVAVDGTAARMRADAPGSGWGPVTVLAAGPDTEAVLHDGPQGFRPERGTVILPWEMAPPEGTDGPVQVVLRAGDATVRLDVQVGHGFGSAALVSRADLAALTRDPQASALWLRAAADADAPDLVSELGAQARTEGVAMAGGLSDRATVEQQLEVMLAAVVGMLAVGVVIALVGVGATLGLSVLERTREHALLRALGLTRSRLRTMLAVEAMLLAGVAGLLGTVLGTAYARVGVEVVLGRVVEGVVLTVPWAPLAALVALAAVAGLVAGVLPARRAARVAPAAGLGAV